MMSQNNVIIILICHSVDIINSILADDKKNNFHIFFVGDKNITDELSNNPRITIARNLPINIEHEKELLTFTAWYAIVKNNLYTEYNYTCILEYDVSFEENFESELIKICEMNMYDCISFLLFQEYFMLDIKESVMRYFLEKKGMIFKNFDDLHWFVTTNHCLKRNILCEFVDWYYPDCLEIKKLEPNKISWYHERLFCSYMNNYSYNTYHLNLLSHGFSNSHNDMHNLSNLSSDLIENYINNPGCEFLKKLIDNYQLFLQLNIDYYTKGGSFLCEHSYSYTKEKYEKQKALFNIAKKSKNAILIGNYMGHVALIMLLANPDLHIICIDTEDQHKYTHILEEYFKKKILFFVSNNQEDIIQQFSNIYNLYDFVYISQQYPTREYLNYIIDECINKSKLNKLTFMLDDYNIYSNPIIENIKNNIQYKIINDSTINIVDNYHSAKIIDINTNLKINKKYLLIYDDGTNNYTNNINNLVNSAKKYDKNLDIIIFHKKDIDNEFMTANEHILNQERGGGYWLWKPYIINETLKKLEENDILFYIDSSYYFTEYFAKLYTNLLDDDLVIWRNKPNEPSYYLKNWCKMDIIHKYNIYNDVFENNMEICWAGAMMMRKTQKIQNMMQEWLNICCCNDITDYPSTIENSTEFYDHRHDQSLLSIVLLKYKIQLHTFEKRYLQNIRQPY